MPDPSHPGPLSILAVVNDEGSGVKRLREWLEELGARITEARADQVPAHPAGYDGIVLLGGGFMPDADERAPWLAAERALTRAAVVQEVPLLGICLGAQVLAHATGGTVEANSGTPENGSTPIHRLPDAATDPLFGDLPETFPAMEHHRDRITQLPLDAVHLAHSDTCPIQAFRIGEAAWGVQFHPEISGERIAHWNAEKLARDGDDQAELLQRAREAEPASAASAHALVRAWVDVIRSRAAIAPRFPVVDGHNDLPWECRASRDSSIEGLDTRLEATHTDLPRLREGGVIGQFWSVFVRGDEPDPVRATLQQIDLTHRLIARYPDHLQLVRSAAGAREAIAAGRIASLLGAEGGHSIGDDLAVLRDLARLGVRYMTLTHNDDTSWADSATGEHSHGGLTDRGREIVREMESAGMLVDLSHVSDETMHQALDVATVPVLFSHSGVRAVCDHPRNVPDDVLERLPGNGGVLQLTFVPMFVSAERHAWEEAGKVGQAPVVTTAQVADHVEHAREIVGIGHIGLGGDYDGIDRQPQGLEDVSGYPHLADELERRGWSPAELRALAGENMLRLLEDTDGR